MQCKVCGSKTNFKLRGVISPWIRELGVTRKRLSNLTKCGDCEFAIFDEIYSEKGMSILYGDYRGANYTATRQKWEPWYNTSYNHGHELDFWLDARVSAIKSFLSELDFPNMHIVDVGGDTGDIAMRLGSASFEVVEVSNRVQYGSTEPEASEKIALCTHVLEHVGDPIAFLRDLSNQYPAVYLEVPSGVPAHTRSRQSRLTQLMALLCSLTPSIWSRLTSPATGRGSSSNVLRQSEHLSFWKADHFRYLSKLLNVNIVAAEGTIRTPDGGTMKIVQVLMSKI